MLIRNGVVVVVAAVVVGGVCFFWGVSGLRFTINNIFDMILVTNIYSKCPRPHRPHCPLCPRFRLARILLVSRKRGDWGLYCFYKLTLF